MQNKLKPLLSMVAIGMFLLFAAASIEPDASTNTTVAISNCKVKPSVSSEADVHIFYHTKTGEPIPNAPGLAFITHQEVDDTTACTFTVLTWTADIITDAQGNYTLLPLHYSHDNSQDLFRVEIVMSKTAFYDEVRKVQVQKFNISDFNFNLVGLRLNDL